RGNSEPLGSVYHTRTGTMQGRPSALRFLTAVVPLRAVVNATRMKPLRLDFLDSGGLFDPVVGKDFLSDAIDCLGAHRVQDRARRSRQSQAALGTKAGHKLNSFLAE